MSTRRAELFATLARTFAELAELEGGPHVEHRIAELAELVLDAAGVVDLAGERARRGR